ncbi:MAG: NAD(+)/NADH kinase [Cyanobacteria bacterium SZAS TMP-1]|nr:NAD(+)/NADH kinase [Cyanobacteria bacterium SZAS TMP-1]
MKLRKVLVVHKKSTYQIQAEEHKEARFLKLLEEGSEVVNRVKIAHEEHVATLNSILAELDKRGIEYQSLRRSEVEAVVKDVDLVISVGGDGTFLDASHAVFDLPMLGVNSSGSSSFGHFCLAKKDSFARALDGIEAGTIEPLEILRLEVSINGEPVRELVLNEVLIAHSNPAATSRYIIEVGDAKEEQRSSGLWIGTPAGSTGSLRSAGGVIMPIDDNQYQYFVREPCQRPGQHWQLLMGLVSGATDTRITSEMRTGEIYIDGPHIIYPLTFGDQLTLKRSKHSLIAYINKDVNKIFSPHAQQNTQSTSFTGKH